MTKVELERRLEENGGNIYSILNEIRFDYENSREVDQAIVDAIEKNPDQVLENATLFSGIFEHMSTECGSKLLSIAKEKGQTKEMFRAVSEQAQLQMLKLDDISDEELVEYAKNTSMNNLQYFMNHHPRAVYLYKEFNQMALIDNGISFPKDIREQKDFFNNLKGENFVQFRRNINRAMENNYSVKLDERVNDYRESIINSYDPETKKFKQYEGVKNLNDVSDLFMQRNKDKNFVLNDEALRGMYDVADKEEQDLDKYLQDVTKGKLSEVVMDGLFTDTKRNAILNIKEMLRYNSKIENKLLSEKDEEFYSIFQNIDSYGSDEIIDMYNKLKNQNITSRMYQDMSKLREDSYRKIAECVYNPDKNPQDINLEQTDKTGAVMYGKSKEARYMMVRCLENPFKEGTNSSEQSYSLIDVNNPQVLSETGFIYGYGEVDPESIVHVHESDSYSHATGNSNRDNSDRVNRIMTPEELVEEGNMTEVLIRNKKNEDYVKGGEGAKYTCPRPSFLTCFGEPTKEVIEESKRMGIPICTLERSLEKNNRFAQYEKAEKYDLDIN